MYCNHIEGSQIIVGAPEAHWGRNLLLTFISYARWDEHLGSKYLELYS
jgi:hypothetical protein